MSIPYHTNILIKPYQCHHQEKFIIIIMLSPPSLSSSPMFRQASLENSPLIRGRHFTGLAFRYNDCAFHFDDDDDDDDDNGDDYDDDDNVNTSDKYLMCRA